MPVLSGNRYIVPKFIDGINYSRTEIVTSDVYWIFASRGNNMVRLNATNLESSTDAGETWGNTTAFANYTNLLSGYLFRNGNIAMFTKDNKIYLTNMTFSSIVEKTLYEDDYETPYVFHTPINPTYPGSYFGSEAHMTETEDTDVFVFANYCNSIEARGASAVIVPMTDDFGETWIVSYKFGQNHVVRDNGASAASSSGNLLGDASNTNVCRHVHNINYNPYNGKFYMNTGDAVWTFTTPDMEEIGWYEGVYSAIARTITWTRIDFGFVIPRTHRLKATGFFFTPTHIYFASDANPVTVPDEQGIWRSEIETFDTPATHELVRPLWTDYQLIDLKLDPETNIVFGIMVDADTGLLDTLLVVKDGGHGAYATHRLQGSPTLLRVNSPNSKGFYRMDIEGVIPNQTKSFLIKIGDDLFKKIGNL